MFEASSFRLVHHLSHETEYILMGVATVVMAGAIYYAYKTYVQKGTLPDAEGRELKPLHKLIYNKYWVDELYESFITRPLNMISDALHKLVDNQLVDGVVNGVGSAVSWMSGTIRLAQTGNIGFYIFVMVISIVLILFTQLF